MVSRSRSSAQIQGIRNKTPLLSGSPSKEVWLSLVHSPCLGGLTVGEPTRDKGLQEPSGPGPAHLQGPLLYFHSLWVPAMSDSLLFSNTLCSILLLGLYFLSVIYICTVKLYTIGIHLLLCLECHCPLFLLTWQVNSPGLHILHSSKGTGLSSCSHLHYTVDICVLIRKFLGEETFLSSSLSSCLLMDECSAVLRSPRQKSNKSSRLLTFYIGVLLPFLE